MLKRISIQNFKGIGPRVDIDLRPVTLLFGPNSAGKSTILHAIHYAHAVLESGNADVGRTRLGGNIDLGGFRQLVHNRNLANQVVIKLEYGPDDSDYRETFAKVLQMDEDGFWISRSSVLVSSCSLRASRGLPMPEPTRASRCP